MIRLLYSVGISTAASIQEPLKWFSLVYKTSLKSRSEEIETRGALLEDLNKLSIRSVLLLGARNTAQNSNFLPFYSGDVHMWDNYHFEVRQEVELVPQIL